MLASRRVAVAILPLLLYSAGALAQPEPPQNKPQGDTASPQPDASSAPSTPPAPQQPPAAEPPPQAPPMARPPLMPPQPPSTGEEATGTPAVSPQPTASPETRGEVGTSPDQVFAEDWWNMARPVFELHGYFRMRAELFHNFYLGRVDPTASALWAHPADNAYTEWSNGQVNPHDLRLCGDSAYASQQTTCHDRTQAGANMRFRLNPELHVSDNLRIMSQIDLLDNVVMGSTPEGYANEPSSSGGYRRVVPSGYAGLSAFTPTNAESPVAGQNSYGNSIAVKRVWGEYVTPIGQLRFGRMPWHWGLGMFANSGDHYDSDYQTTVDRIMFVSGIKSADLYFGGAWDFPNEGAISSRLGTQQGQPYDLAQLDDVNQYSVMVMRRRNPAMQKLELARGDVVINGGVYFVYRNQFLANDNYTGYGEAESQYLGVNSDSVRQGYVRRNAKMYIPDLWFQLLYKKFRFELEAVTVTGSVENTGINGTNNYENRVDPSNNGWKVRQFGLATQTEYKTIEDRLRLNFGFGWASGDSDDLSLTPSTAQQLQKPVTGNRTFSAFRFHPDYRVDLIFFRHILNRVQGTYYFRPSVDYDFSRNPNGQKVGGGAAIIWSRASEFVQAPGHKRDLGVEIDLNLYFQSKDGALNDDANKMGGFYTMLQYGVFFPMGGLDYMPGEKDQASQQNISLSTSTAQTLRWYAGIFF